MRLYIQYVESQRSEADKGISLNANWNKQALGIGAMWLVSTILFKFVFGRFVMGHSWIILFADCNILEGRMCSLVLLRTFIGPYVFFKIRREK